jgi:hypothetical protein
MIFGIFGTVHHRYFGGMPSNRPTRSSTPPPGPNALEGRSSKTMAVDEGKSHRSEQTLPK